MGTATEAAMQVRCDTCGALPGTPCTHTATDYLLAAKGIVLLLEAHPGLPAPRQIAIGTSRYVAPGWDVHVQLDTAADVLAWAEALEVPAEVGEYSTQRVGTQAIARWEGKPYDVPLMCYAVERTDG